MRYFHLCGGMPFASSRVTNTRQINEFSHQRTEVKDLFAVFKMFLCSWNTNYKAYKAHLINIFINTKHRMKLEHNLA